MSKLEGTIEDRLRQLIVDALMLDDVKPEEIELEAPLFVEGLGLDSIDALELALAIQQEFGVKTSEHDERNRERFYSIKTLAEFIRSEQGRESSEEAPAAVRDAAAAPPPIAAVAPSET